jgi:hypothetical protein
MFKNEAAIMREWIEHYLSEGVDHFYFLDDGSSDNFTGSQVSVNLFLDTIFLQLDPADPF